MTIVIWLQIPAVGAVALYGGGSIGRAVAVTAVAAAIAAFLGRLPGSNAAVRAGTATLISLASLPVALATALAGATGVRPFDTLVSGELGVCDAFAYLAAVLVATAAPAQMAEIERLDADLQAKLSELRSVSADRERLTAERDDAALRLDALAHHDDITGLPNRVLMMQRLTAALAAQNDVLVLYLDLSDLKAVNETTGHAAGDRALAIIAARIRRCIRGGDTASRVGGDEFVIVCSSRDAVAEGPHIADRLIAAVSEPIAAGQAKMRLGSNIGISVARTDGDDPDELIRKAEAAMYRAKDGGVNSFHIYKPEIHAEMLERSILRRDLESAIANDEFIVHYQPIMSLTSRAIIGAEALVRWAHPVRGLLAPADFVAFAETQGLITRIGEAVMDKACAQISRFAACTNADFTMAVNVSALQFRRPDFVDTVRDLLERHAVDSARFEIEITESVIMDDMTSVVASLHALDALGVRLSIDDFGTGYSSLAYLKHFPVQTLKIDRSFVRDLAESPTDQAIAATIITLAHNLGMRVVAEGIETRDQLERLRLLGADDMQGFVLSAPLTADEFERFVRSAGTLRFAA